eukprot:403339487
MISYQKESHANIQENGGLSSIQYSDNSPQKYQDDNSHETVSDLRLRGFQEGAIDLPKDDSQSRISLADAANFQQNRSQNIRSADKYSKNRQSYFEQAHAKGGQRRKLMENIMHDNFKILERIKKQKSGYSASKMGVEDIDPAELTANKKFNKNRNIPIKKQSINVEENQQNSQNIRDNQRIIEPEEEDKSDQNTQEDLFENQSNLAKQYQSKSQDIPRNPQNQVAHQSHFLPKIDSQIQIFNKQKFENEKQRKVIKNQESSWANQLANQHFNNHIGSSSQTRIVSNISMQYEKGQLRKHYVELEQVYNLPRDRQVLTQQQAIISGRKSEYLVELSLTKLKFFVTVVKISNPHKFEVAEYNRFKYERVLKNLGGNLNSIIHKLEFANGKLLVIKDFDKLLQIKQENGRDRSQQYVSIKKNKVKESVEIPLVSHRLKKNQFVSQKQLVTLDELRNRPQVQVIQQKMITTTTTTTQEYDKNKMIQKKQVESIQKSDEKPIKSFRDFNQQIFNADQTQDFINQRESSYLKGLKTQRVSIQSKDVHRSSEKRNNQLLQDKQRQIKSQNLHEISHQNDQNNQSQALLKPGARLRGNIKKSSLRTIIERASDDYGNMNNSSSIRNNGVFFNGQQQQLEHFLSNINSNNSRRVSNQSSPDKQTQGLSAIRRSMSKSGLKITADKNNTLINPVDDQEPDVPVYTIDKL